MQKWLFLFVLLIPTTALGSELVSVDCGPGPKPDYRFIFDPQKSIRQQLNLDSEKAINDPYHGRILPGEVTETELVIRNQSLLGDETLKFSIPRATGIADVVGPRGQKIHVECKPSPTASEMASPALTPENDGVLSAACALEGKEITMAFNPASLRLLASDEPAQGFLPGRIFRFGPDAIAFCISPSGDCSFSDGGILINTITSRAFKLRTGPYGLFVDPGPKPGICTQIPRPQTARF